jgi:hypothetical protein
MIVLGKGTTLNVSYARWRLRMMHAARGGSTAVCISVGGGDQKLNKILKSIKH